MRQNVEHVFAGFVCQRNRRRQKALEERDYPKIFRIRSQVGGEVFDIKDEDAALVLDQLNQERHPAASEFARQKRFEQLFALLPHQVVENERVSGREDNFGRRVGQVDQRRQYRDGARIETLLNPPNALVQ